MTLPAAKYFSDGHSIMAQWYCSIEPKRQGWMKNICRLLTPKTENFI